MEKSGYITLKWRPYSGLFIFLLFISLGFFLQLSSPQTAHARAVECAACHSSGVGSSPHTVQHNNTIVPGSVCGQCHDANVRIEHTDNRAIDCELCHTPDGPLFNARYDAAITQGMGSGGTSVDCWQCHDFFNHLPQHDNVSATPAQCSSCHTANITDTHNNNCTLCHESANTIVSGIIQQGRSDGGNQAVTCAGCHTSGGAASHGATCDTAGAAHEALITSVNCSGCHNSVNFEALCNTHRSDCTVCHLSTEQRVVDTITAGRAGTPVSCENCHDMHNATADHNMLSTSVNCSTCHATGDFNAILTTHRYDCALCHTSTRTDVVNTINTGKGAAGIPVNCENCHTAHDGPTAHNNLSTSVNCSTCHTTGDFNAILTTHQADCTVCHTSTRQAVIDTINSGIAGTAVNCENCHTAHDGPTDHNMLSTSTNCSTCHVSGTFNDISSLHRADCTLCHTSTRQAVIDAIDAGRAGTAVNCENCHVGHADPAGDHNNVSAAVNCSTCHTTGDFNAILTTHRSDCALCHSSTRQAVIDTINTGQGAGGVPVNCENCHTAHEGETDHDMLSTSVNCSTCHTTGDFNAILTTHQADCTLCHTNTRQAVIETINDGKAGTPVNCENCHAPHDGPAIHENLSTSANCSSCHFTNTFDMILGTHMSDCTLCHSSTRPEVVQAINDGRAGTAVNCESCHLGHAADHDMLSTSANCSTCHTSTSFDDIYTVHRTDCATCHSSTVPRISDTIAAGMAGTAVNCENCHDSHDGPTDHNSLSTSVNCSTCHATADFNAILTTHQADCTLCHSSTRQAVIDTIDAGRAGTSVNCENCHTAHDGATDHDMVSTSANCSTCHVSGTFDEILTTHLLDCTVCHTSTRQVVIDTIDAGRVGTPVNCENCHTTHDGTADHDMLSASANCSTCHVTGTFDEILTTHQADCTLCHTSTRQAVIDTIDAGKAGTPVNCEGCHSTHDEIAAHNNLSTTTPCLGCHFTGSFSFIKSVHLNDCAKCHVPTSTDSLLVTNTLATIDLGKTNGDNQPVNCRDCHGGGHENDHDNLETSVNCSECHVSTNFSEILTLHVNDCQICHSSPRSEVQDAIGNGAGLAGVMQNCENCHVPHGTDHDMLSTSPNCSTCHVSGTIDDIYALHLNDCGTCHSSPRTDVDQTISNGMAGTPVNCENCHSGHGPTDHDNLRTSTNCSSCHTSGTFDAILTTHLSDCATCHNSTRSDVMATIDLGKSAGGNLPVDCENCHTGHVDPAGDHNMLTTSINCSNCHVSDSFNEILSLHISDCALCHSSPRPEVAQAISNGRAGTPVNCENCHVGHAADHDMLSNSPNCSPCHTAGLFDDIYATHQNNCALCHSSTATEIVQTIADGMGGTAVNCENCHGVLSIVHDGPALHNNLNGAQTCSVCHTDFINGTTFDYIHSTHPPLPTLGGTPVERCATCHNSTRPEVINAIAQARGPAGIPVDCESCHVSQHIEISNPSRLHIGTIWVNTGSSCGLCHIEQNRTHTDMSTSSNCSACHTSTNQDEINTLHHNDCLLCHMSARTDVLSAISTGIAGTPVNCENCHGGHADPVSDHDMLSTSGNCSSCHTSGTFDEIQTTHQSNCALCHSSTRQAVIDTIAAGISDTAVDCNGCHAPHSFDTHQISENTGCDSCHTVLNGTLASIETIHDVPTNGTGSCATCHSSTRPDVTAAIAAGQPVDCSACHVGHEGPTDHNKLSTSTNCSGCHSSGEFNAIYALHLNNCATCHGSIRTNVINTISAGSGPAGVPVNCDNCHAGHTDPAGDHNALNTSSNCSSCHSSGDFNAIYGLHLSNCATCHSSTRTDVINTINAGSGGIAVNCENCHTGHTDPAGDHNSLSTSSNCSSCHSSSNFNAISSLHRSDCGLCHSSTRQAVIDTIAAGSSGTAVDCEDCHTGHDGAADHDRLSTTTPCSDCHAGSNFDAILTMHVNSCSTCHSSSRQEVIDTISAGMGGIAVNCQSCHGAGSEEAHHGGSEARSGNCTWCHNDPRSVWSSATPGDNGSNEPLPTQLACAECHVRVSGPSGNHTIEIERIDYYGDYSRAPNRSVVHSLSGMAIDYIYNYGMCFDCHNGSDAAAVPPFHAKPSFPANHQTWGCVDARYAPGRGTFNHFWSEFNADQDSGPDSESYRSCENESRQYRDPEPGYGYMINIPCIAENGCSGSSTIAVPVLAAMPEPAGGGEPPPPPPSGGGCDVDPNGTYVEAEDYNVFGTNFTEQSGDGNGGMYLYATANSTSSPSGSPVEYDLNFTETGTYYIWFRGKDNGSTGDNSLWYGIDGSMVGNATTPASNSNWNWTSMPHNTGPNPTRIIVNSTGTHTITIWARENGFRFDGFYLTNSSGSVSGSIPSGASVVDPTNCGGSSTGGSTFSDYQPDWSSGSINDDWNIIRDGSDAWRISTSRLYFGEGSSDYGDPPRISLSSSAFDPFSENYDIVVNARIYDDDVWVTYFYIDENLTQGYALILSETKNSGIYECNDTGNGRIDLNSPYSQDCTQRISFTRPADRGGSGSDYTVNISVRTVGGDVQITAGYVQSGGNSDTNNTYTDTSPVQTYGTIGFATGSMNSGNQSYMTNLDVTFP